MAQPKKLKKPPELTDGQYSKLLEDLEEFNSKFFEHLAGTEKYEIIPTVMDDGSLLTKEQYALVKTECSRLGLKVLYEISLRGGKILYFNPETCKVGYIDEGMH